MEVNLSPDLEGKLARAAGRRGVLADVLIREAIERAVEYDDWFIREVEKGLAQIDAGQVLTHDAVGARLEQKLAEHQSRRSRLLDDIRAVAEADERQTRLTGR